MFIEVWSRLVQLGPIQYSSAVADRRELIYNRLCFLQPCRRARDRFREKLEYYPKGCKGHICRLTRESRRLRGPLWINDAQSSNPKRGSIRGYLREVERLPGSRSSDDFSDAARANTGDDDH